MNYRKFQIGFWHPFGPHGKEPAEEILERKSKEVLQNGWTLWSFQRRRMLDAWRNQIIETGPDAVYVFCSGGTGAADPPNAPAPCVSYRLIGETSWKPIPAGVKVPHPFRPGVTEASAFVVKRVIYPIDFFERPTVEWFSLKRGPWRHEKVPTRGEYLIRAGAGERLRRCRAVLVLQDPYLAVVSTGVNGRGHR